MIDFSTALITSKLFLTDPDFYSTVENMGLENPFSASDGAQLPERSAVSPIVTKSRPGALRACPGRKPKDVAALIVSSVFYPWTHGFRLENGNGVRDPLLLARMPMPGYPEERAPMRGDPLPLLDALSEIEGVAFELNALLISSQIVEDKDETPEARQALSGLLCVMQRLTNDIRTSLKDGLRAYYGYISQQAKGGA